MEEQQYQRHWGAFFFLQNVVCHKEGCGEIQVLQMSKYLSEFAVW